jgi:hypothetical protein
MATASDSADTTMAFWKPGMPVKAFDPYSIERVKADLADGSITEFPVEDYKEYLIQKVREIAIRQESREFTIEPYERYRYGEMLQYHSIREEHAFSKSCDRFYYNEAKYVSGIAYIAYVTFYDKCQYKVRDLDLLQICIAVGDETGFTNPTVARFSYKITWINEICIDYDFDDEW